MSSNQSCVDFQGTVHLRGDRNGTLSGNRLAGLPGRVKAWSTNSMKTFRHCLQSLAAFHRSGERASQQLAEFGPAVSIPGSFFTLCTGRIIGLSR